jgi:hypothetical protein
MSQKIIVAGAQRDHVYKAPFIPENPHKFTNNFLVTAHDGAALLFLFRRHIGGRLDFRAKSAADFLGRIAKGANNLLNGKRVLFA